MKQRQKKSSYSGAMDDSPGIDAPPPPPINDNEYGKPLFFRFILVFSYFSMVFLLCFKLSSTRDSLSMGKTL
jgi:hypothetical protein